MSVPGRGRKEKSRVLPVHVAVGGEGLAAHRALVGPLPAVHQHVTVQGAGRAQGLSTDAAGVVRTPAVSVVLKREGGITGINSGTGSGLVWPNFPIPGFWKGSRCDAKTPK